MNKKKKTKKKQHSLPSQKVREIIKPLKLKY